MGEDASTGLAAVPARVLVLEYTPSWAFSKVFMRTFFIFA